MAVNLPHEIAAEYIDTGAAKTKIAPAKMFVLAVMAGIFIAFGAVASTPTSNEVPSLLQSTSSYS